MLDVAPALVLCPVNARLKLAINRLNSTRISQRVACADGNKREVGPCNLGLKCWFSENETESKAVCSAPRRPVQEAGGAEEVVPAARATEGPEPHHGQETIQAPTQVRMERYFRCVFASRFTRALPA